MDRSNYDSTMNRIRQLSRRLCVHRVRWPFLAGLLVFVMAQVSFAADALYENNGVVEYPGIEQFPPQIDATNFVNNNTFIVDLTALLPPYDTEVYETSDTVNYTNNGFMEISPDVTFDTFSTSSGLETMAGNFYNPGQIYVGANCVVDVSNIVSPGTIDVPNDGLIQLTGENVDLSRGILTVEGNGSGFNGSVFGVGAFGLNTNKNYTWNPGTSLTPTTAMSSGPPYPYFLSLPDSTPYFNFVPSDGGTNDIIRSAFIEDFSVPTVPFEVFFGTNAVGRGDVTVVWYGIYTNYATGLPATNYLYLNNDYVLGASTNNMLVGNAGYPSNFVFTESPVNLFPNTAPAPVGFYNVYPNLAISNAYSYVTASLASSTTATNASLANPTGTITNLPGRIQIIASNELNLSYSSIGDPNFISIIATNQFNGNFGGSLITPFSDIGLGVTNGILTFSNLVVGSIPVWTGTIDAWSTDFLITNSTGGSNDDRVLIVGSYNLKPVSLGYVQNLTLHGTNVVLSDALNILAKLYIDAQNLTLTTNPIAAGATSPAGELIWENTAILLSNSLPNLQNLTNNGVIQCPNLISLGTQSAPLQNVINNGTISDGGTALWVANNFLNSGDITSDEGSFQLNASTVTMTNSEIIAPGNISIAATTIQASNVVLDAGYGLTLTADVLSDGFTNGTAGLTNGNFWYVGYNAISASPGSYLENGFNLPFSSIGTGLLGTTVASFAPANHFINNLWAAQDYGASNVGFTNNAAIGQLILDAEGPGPGTQLYFSGTGVSNAIYVDRLILTGYSSYTNHTVVYSGSSNSIPSLGFNTNLVIYYADAVASGFGDASFQINGFNGNHLRWVPTYVGYFSATNIVYPNGTTNTFNVGLAESKFYSSDGSGVPNADDPTPFFVQSQMGLAARLTNNPAKTVAISWNTIPFATNFVYYSTNLLSWQLLTNPYSPTNGWFVTPTPGPGPATNIMILDPITGQQKFYQVIVSPDLLYP